MTKRLNILAPADSAVEAAALIEAGAGSLYFGYQPAKWAARHLPLESFNRRTFPEAQIGSLDEVRALADLSREREVPVWATCNAAYYPESMCGPLMDMIRDLKAAGVTGFIVADPGLILRLRREGIGQLALSTMGGVMNARAARFFAGLGVRRITLPRDLSVAEIAAVALANPDLAFDVFVLFGACPNQEPFCRWVHDDPGRVWPCVQEWRPAGVSPGSAEDTVARTQAAWSGVSRVWACGLCALADLARIPNLEGLKVVGRGAPTARKLAGVSILRRLLDLVGEGVSGGEYRAAARAAKLESSGAGCLPRLCSFPEYL